MTKERALAPTLIGRQTQLLELHGLLERARRGEGVLVFLAGDAGQGKTRLVREFVAEARLLPGVSVLRGRCYDEALVAPYGPFIDAISSLAREREASIATDPQLGELLRLLPELDDAELPVGPVGDLHAQKRRLFERICRALGSENPQGCRIIVLEDLHWSDQTSQELILYLARAVEGRGRLLVLGTYRSDELNRRHPLTRLIGDLARERLYNEVKVPPLSIEELAQLLEATLDQPANPEIVRAIYRHSEGNPFFVEEILQSLIESGHLAELLAAAEQGRSIAQIAIPASVKESILARTTDLDPIAAEALNYAAVIGRRFDFELLQQLTALSEPELVRVIEQLVVRQLVVEDRASREDRYSFRHALIREALYDDMLGRERRMKHRAVLQALESGCCEGEPLVDQLAYHSLQARELAKAVQYARQAGERATRMYAYREALAHYEAALELQENDAVVERAELLERLAETAYPLGDQVRMARYWREALRLYEQLGERRKVADIARRLGRVAWDRGDAATAFEHTHHAIAMLEADGPSRELARAYSALSHLYMNSNQLHESISWGEKALALAEAVGDEAVKTHALNNVGCSLIDSGEDERGIAALEQSLELALKAGLFVDAVRACLNLGASLFGLGTFGRARQLLGQGLDLADRMGVEMYNESLLSKLAYVELELGNWQECERLIELAIRSTLRPQRWPCELAPVQVELLLRRNQIAAARQLIEQQLPIAARDDEWALAWLLFLQSQAVLAEGDLEGATLAIDRSMALWPRIENSAKIKGFAHEVIAIYLAVGKPEQARELLGLFDLPGRGELLLTQGAKATACGLLAAYEGRHADAALLLAEASDCWQQLGLCFEELAARRWWAASLLQTAAIEEASGELERARALAERLGALAELELIAALEPRRVAARSGQRLAGAGIDGLTRREQQVLALLIRGYSNRAIAEELVISEKTVEIHVSNILGKLGVSSRAQAAAYAREQGVTRTRG